MDGAAAARDPPREVGLWEPELVAVNNTAAAATEEEELEDTFTEEALSIETCPALGCGRAPVLAPVARLELSAPLGLGLRATTFRSMAPKSKYSRRECL